MRLLGITSSMSLPTAARSSGNPHFSAYFLLIQMIFASVLTATAPSHSASSRSNSDFIATVLTASAEIPKASDHGFRATTGIVRWPHRYKLVPAQGYSKLSRNSTAVYNARHAGASWRTLPTRAVHNNILRYPDFLF